MCTSFKHLLGIPGASSVLTFKTCCSSPPQCNYFSKAITATLKLFFFGNTPQSHTSNLISVDTREFQRTSWLFNIQTNIYRQNSG
ncbi:hypothetical protein FKM82_009902 [Ascaphus truei]